MAILSTPNPNARPLYCLESILQFLKLLVYNSAAKISSHFPDSDNISTSADGSVNGKYEGLNLISTSLPNKSLSI